MRTAKEIFEALRVLRHYPMGFEVADSRSFDEQAVQEWYARYERQA